MVSWILVAILVILALIIIKLFAVKHKFFLILFVFLILFFYISVSYVAEKNKLDLSSTQGFFHATKVYIGWLGNGFDNLKDLTARAIDMDWKSTNKTFSEKK